MATQNPIRLGMVGGGEGSFIGYIHRVAARLDGLLGMRFIAAAVESSAADAKWVQLCEN